MGELLLQDLDASGFAVELRSVELADGQLRVLGAVLHHEYAQELRATGYCGGWLSRSQ